MRTILYGGVKMRKRRQLLEGAIYHVTAKANRGEFILRNLRLKQLFLSILKKAKKKYKFSLTTFCIMNNHIHLMIKPEKNENLSRIMQWILSKFAIAYNKIFKLFGHVWYDRFHSTIIYNFLQYVRTFLYIGENPVKANIVSKSVDYKYGGMFYLKRGFYDILAPPENSLKIIFPDIFTTYIK
jgi:putative transposase